MLTGATGTQTLTPANNYLLRGRVQVGDGLGTPHILTIEPGTVLLGENSTDGYLVVERGAQIIANGTAANPIIMTTDLAPGSMVRGGWGGLVIHGRAVANCADCLGGQSCESEGGNAGFFCGGNDCDGSGSLKYVRVEYAGIDIATDNELNAFTFNGVGCNMNAQYLQAHMGFDDNFEWFGGSMSARYLVSTGGGDDGIDWQMGWRGGVQFAIDQHYDDDGDKGIEADNNEFTLNAPCRSNPTLANLTLIGPNDPFGNPTDGINLRRGTDAQIFNSIVQGWPEFALQVQNVESCARGFNPDPGVFCGPAVDVEATTPNIANVALRAFPNPVTQRANFAFSLDRAGEVDLSIFDVSGRMIANVMNSSLPAGSHNVAWDVPSSVTSGVYMYRFASGGQRQTGRFFRVK